MTIIRRTYSLPAEPAADSRAEILVTHDDTTGELLVGHRHHPWDEWSRPLTHTTAEDDDVGPGRYGPDGVRQYDRVPPEELDAPGPDDAAGPVPADGSST